MITTSDIIVKLISDAGYKSPNEFAVKNNINNMNLAACIRQNTWTKALLAKVGKALGKDLSKLVTATLGRKVGTRCKFE